MEALLRRRRPCPRCPFRRDLVGDVAFPNLRDYAAGTCVDEHGTGPEIGAPLFACHVDGPEVPRLCAGWLAVEGHAHPSVRPGEDWPELFGSAVEMCDVQAYDARLTVDPRER
jgi:hypothetical protein